VRQVLAVLVVGLLGGGVATVAIRRANPAPTFVHTDTTQPPVVETNIVPAPGQSLVSGTLQLLSSDDATTDPIHTPFTINAVERGARSNATIEGGIVGGSRKTIYWDAGTPMPVSGNGALDLGACHVDVAPSGVTWALAGAARGFVPGRYHVGSPVAIGTGGLASPSDGGADFTADDHTVMQATPGVILHLDLPAAVEGPGSMRMTGRFTVRTASGQQTATTIVFGPGPFKVMVGPGGTVAATLQGPVKLS
jgi:hypothetical protein